MNEYTPETLRAAPMKWATSADNATLGTLQAEADAHASTWEAAIEENERATELWGAAKKIKRAFGLWLPRTENTNVPKEMTDALEALFAILAQEKPR